MSFIDVRNVVKEYRVYKKEEGFYKNLKSLFYRKYDVIKAVYNISFQIDKGEIVGYIGPNGAGKSTTIKMLSGILTPTTGEIYVDGIIPYEKREINAMKIGVVFGQRSQLYWDLPLTDTFQLYKKMYKINDAIYNYNVQFYMDLLAMKEFMFRPVRQLSLGEKMRANLAIALLHNPDIIYLDEPTIGLDVLAKSRIRTFIRAINKEKGTTVILTTHDMDDIEQICNRIIMIDKGSIIYDGTIESFKNEYGSETVIAVEFQDENVIISDPRLKVIKEKDNKKYIIADKNIISIADAISLLFNSYRVRDISLKESDIEDIVRDIYDNRKSL